MLRLLSSFCVLCGIGLIALAASARADEAAKQAEAVQEASADAKKFDDLLKGLDAQEYADRQAASKALGEEGIKALPTLEKGVLSDSREVSLRCFDLLKKLYESSDASTKQQAKEALERLAKSENNSVVGRVKKVLEPPTQPTPTTPNGVPGIRVVPAVPAGAVPLGGIRLEVRAVAGARRVSVKDVNGVRDIEAIEGDRKVKIHDEPGKGIQVEITETKDGKEETKKYEAKDAEELKKNHPDAHKAYEEYGKKGAPEIKIIGGAGGFGGGILPGGAIPAGGIPVPAALPAAAEAEMKKLKLDSIGRQLDSLQRTIDSLEKQKARLIEQKAELEKEAKKPEDNPAEKKSSQPPVAPAEVK